MATSTITPVKEVNEKRITVRLHRILRDLRMPAEIIVVSREFADRWSEVCGSLVHTALSEGRIITRVD